jgi:predicted nucleic-acid-binding Zn-ribbon protein
MLLAGKKNAELKNKIVGEIICPNCTTKNTTKVSVIGTYKHLFHIPFVADKKLGKSVCSNCNHTLVFTEMPDNIKLAYFELKEKTKTPFWFYSGIIVLKFAIIVKIISRYF